MPVEQTFGNLTAKEALELLGIPAASDPKLAALAATSWGGNALKVLQVNATENGWQFAAVTGFTDEAAQDAVGTILTDSASIDFTYDDGAGTITAIVKDGAITSAKLDTNIAVTGTLSCGGNAALGNAVADTHAVTGASLTLTGNQNATTSFSVVNTDTTNATSRGSLTVQGGSSSFQILALSGSIVAVRTTTASDMQLQRNNAVIATLTASGIDITSTLALLHGGNAVINSSRHPVLRSYTVATLPASGDGELAFASNGRKTGEGVGAGTGLMVYRDGGTWFRPADDTAVAA